MLPRGDFSKLSFMRMGGGASFLLVEFCFFCQVQIRDVKVFPAEGLDVRILCDHFCKGAVSHELRKADSFMTVFNLQTQKAKAYNSAGSLLVSWRRSRFALYHVLLATCT